MANKQAVSRSDADVSLGASGYLVLRLGLESDVHLALVRPALLPGGGMLFSVSPSPISSLEFIYYLQLLQEICQDTSCLTAVLASTDTLSEIK